MHLFVCSLLGFLCVCCVSVHDGDDGDDDDDDDFDDEDGYVLIIYSIRCEGPI